jgi:hypothetical protein
MGRRIEKPTDEIAERAAGVELQARLRRVFVPAVDGPLPAGHVALQRRIRARLDRLERAGTSNVERLAVVLEFLEAERR